MLFSSQATMLHSFIASQSPYDVWTNQQPSEPYVAELGGNSRKTDENVRTLDGTVQKRASCPKLTEQRETDNSLQN